MNNLYAAILITVFLYSNKPAELRSQEISGIPIGNGFSIIPSLNYVSSASIQMSPFSSDVIERGFNEELTGGYGYGFSLRKNFFRDDLSFGITTEFLKIVDSELIQTFETGASRVRTRITEELTVVPVELTGFFNIPDFSEDLRIFLGGGVGVYFGDRKRTIQNVQSKTISKQAGFSFVILSGLEYIINTKFSGVFEVRFRQGEYKVKSEFPVSAVSINGGFFPIEKNLNSKIYIDGLKLSLGIAYNF